MQLYDIYNSEDVRNIVKLSFKATELVPEWSQICLSAWMVSNLSDFYNCLIVITVYNCIIPCHFNVFAFVVKAVPRKLLRYCISPNKDFWTYFLNTVYILHTCLLREGSHWMLKRHEQIMQNVSNLHERGPEIVPSIVSLLKDVILQISCCKKFCHILHLHVELSHRYLTLSLFSSLLVCWKLHSREAKGANPQPKVQRCGSERACGTLWQLW